jgi:hypothetical protein
MPDTHTHPDDHAWEKTYAPKVSGGHLFIAAACFALWMAAMTWLAADRWFGTLQ